MENLGEWRKSVINATAIMVQTHKKVLKKSKIEFRDQGFKPLTSSHPLSLPKDNVVTYTV